MAAESQDKKPETLPFEPTSNKKKAAKPTESGTATAKAKSTQSISATSKRSQAAASREAQAVPQVVSQRMARRMAFFCGIPTLLGMSSFVVSYYVVTQLHYKLPSTVVLLVSLGFFGLGVLGLTYGIFSASWEEATPGSLLGMEEFRTNFQRMMQARKEAKQVASNSRN
ncbi:MAG: PAM68 family protein [Synechococcales bacterium]|nr:PAM68 family protein [Synechococcales bacterium]